MLSENEIEYLRAARTLTQAEVDERGRLRDSLDPFPSQRLESAAHHPEGQPSRH